MMSFCIKIFTILNICGVGYACIIFRISKNKVAYVLKNSDLSEKRIIIRFINHKNHYKSQKSIQKSFRRTKKENMEETL